MKYILRVIGWLLLGMGAVMTTLEVLALNGVTQLKIEFFGIHVDSETERTTWLIGWAIAVVAGFVLLYIAKQNQHHKGRTR